MPIRVTTDNDIAIVTIDRPEARGAINPQMANALYDAFVAFDTNPAHKVAILTGTSGTFCAGFDLKVAASEINEDWFAEHTPADTITNTKGPMGPTRLELSKPVIAAITGPAVAGGMELALWCDLRVMEESAYMGVYCRRWGVPLIDGGTIRLPRIVGHGRAMDLILTGRKVEAEEALHIGLANRLCPDGAALDTALELARDLTRFPQGCMRADRQSAIDQWSLDLPDAITNEWKSAQSFRSEGTKGAARFKDGKGRRGDFDDV